MTSTRNPNIVVNHHPAGGTPRRTPLLFVHGAWHNATCWEAFFMPYFAGQGYDCYALNLRGHGESEGRERLRWTRIREYVADVAKVAGDIKAETGVSPVVIGHSMGGFITQKYLQAHPDAPAGVLLASIPPHGSFLALNRVTLRFPLATLGGLLRLSVHPTVTDRERYRKLFLSPNLSDDAINEYHAQTQDESFMMLLDASVLDLPTPSKVKPPLLVIGGGLDAFFPAWEVERTARAYGIGAHIFPDMAHNLMVEPEWERVAELIRDWLQERVN